MKTLQRGDIYNVALPQHINSSVEQGYRPCVVISSLTGLLNSDIVTVCPLTTKIKDYNVNVNVSWSKDTRPNQVLCNQIFTIPRHALQLYVGSLTELEMVDVTSTICAALGITENLRADIQKSTIALNQAKADREEAEKLIPQAKQMINELTQLISRINNTKIRVTKKGRIKRTDADLAEFVKEWEDPNNDHNEVYESFGFNSYSTAYQTYQRYRRKHNGT